MALKALDRWPLMEVRLLEFNSQTMLAWRWVGSWVGEGGGEHGKFVCVSRCVGGE